MSFLQRLSSRAWIPALVCSLVFTLWVDRVRMRHVELVSGIAGGDIPADPRSPTGYADGKRWLIVPEHDNPTYQWIEETQLMLARGDWRVRRVDYENAPFGRDAYSASPYRWWLVLVASADHAVSGASLALCVERAALYANPLLHAALLAGATALVAWRLGSFAAALLCLGLAAIFPLAGAFIPGVANDFGLGQICALLSVLLLVAGRQAPRWYFAAGVAGGCGLWLSATAQAPIIAGIAAGAVLATLVARAGSPAAMPWRAWAAGGAASSLIAYLVEFFPGHMDMQLRANYPLYGLAWLGLGELLARFASWMRGDARRRGLAGALAWALAAAAVASLPVAIWRAEGGAFLAGDLLSSRLTSLPDGVVATGLWEWLVRGSRAGALTATCVPLVLLCPAAWLLLGRRTGAAHRAAIAVCFGPVLVALALALLRLRWWNTFDAVLLALLVAAASAVPESAHPRIGRWMLSGLLCAVLAFGVAQLAPSGQADGSGVLRFTQAEAEGLYERFISHWIADRAGPEGATVLAPPFRTSSLCFYGGVRGLGTQSWENRDGLAATFHIVTSMHPDESRAVISQHGVTHIVLPSWDTDLDDFARMKLKDPQASFVYALNRTEGLGFSWLRPLPLELPPVAGSEDQSVLVLEVTDETDPATAQGRFVEYLVESRRIDQAVAAGGLLLRYPADLGSQAAMAQLEKAQGDDEAFAKVLRSIVSGISAGADRSLAWDRRVSVAVVLAIGGRTDLSREQVRRCVGEMTEARARFLTTESLYHLLVLCNRYGIEIGDPKLRELSLKLLPEKLRGRL
jgi:hypothetical protein